MHGARQLLGWPHACQIRLDLRDRARGGEPQSGQRRTATTYKAGERWSELPGDHHAVGANASEMHPAKLLAVFVVDTNETELTIPIGN